MFALCVICIFSSVGKKLTIKLEVLKPTGVRFISVLICFCFCFFDNTKCVSDNIPNDFILLYFIYLADFFFCILVCSSGSRMDRFCPLVEK